MNSDEMSNQKEEEQSLLKSVHVVCREIPSFSTHPEVAQRIEVFLDYAPQYGLHRACWILSLRLVKRVYLSQKWDQEAVVRGLSYAAMEGKLEVIKWLCKKEKDKGVLTKNLITGFNQRDYCYIPVCMAAGDGHTHVLQWLLDNGVDVNEKDYTGQTALLEAARGGHFSTVQWLIENGASINEVDRDGDSVLLGAVCTGNLELVEYFVGNGADVKQTNDAGMTALHYAVGVEENEILVHYLLDQGLQISDEDKRGRTAVYYASAAGNFDIMKFLLREGFKENKPPEKDLQFTLVEAVRSDRLDFVEYLNEYGVGLHFVNFRGWNVLHDAAAGGGVHVIQFLIENGVDVHLADKFSITPAMEACRHGHHEILRCLLEAGGSISTVDLAGQSPLHLAAQGNHTSIVEELLKNAVDVDCCDQRGWTPLHSAAVTVKTCEVVKLLVANGAKFDAKTLSGQTAEDLAISRGHSDVATYLRGLRIGNTESDVSDPLGQANFDEYKEYLLDRTQVHFNSITTTMQSSSDGSWLDAPIEVKVKKLGWSSKAFVEALATWSQLNHPHVVKLYGYCHSDNETKEPYFVCERAIHESMYGYLDSADATSLDDIWDKIYQVALGLQYLHDRNIIHGTLSAYSIVIALNGVAKLHVFDGASGGVLPWRSAPEILAGLPASFKSDMFAFGLVIIDAVKRGARMWGPLDGDDAIISGKLPKKPDDMTASQWSLIERMCCYDYRERLSASDVVRELEGIISRKTLIRELVSDTKALDWTGETIGWINIGELWMGECTLSVLLHEIDEMCGGSMTIDKMNRDVYNRLIDIYNQLRATSGDPVQDVIQQYGNVVRYFHSRLQATSAVGSAQAARFAASRQGADDTFSVHKDIDHFAELAGLSSIPQIHQWREQWELRHRQQKSDMLESLENLSTLLEDVADEKEREEALIHLRFELSKHPTSYATSKAADFIHAKSTIAPLSSSIKNPSWFIPAHEVHFAKFDEFSRGAFGTVYHGQWKLSQVVVKKVKLKNDEDQAVFLKEVEIWHKLHHPNVVQLYGACHIQKPFFVCEFASNGQLDVFLRDHPDQVWEKLYEAALGLRYLHMKHIVHGDLKCNNILVGSNGKAKLTDFGLSVMDTGKAEPEAETEIAIDEKVSIGAIRWKAPEVLCGEKATFASDVYSFGMCVLESVSGKFPWGMTLDPVVKYYVLKLKRIPQRPENCSEDAYVLVERMCRFDPSKRMQMNQVVDALKALR